MAIHESPEKSPIETKVTFPAWVLPPCAAPCPTLARIRMNVRQIHPEQTCGDWVRSVPSHQHGAMLPEPTSQCKSTNPRQPQKHLAKRRIIYNMPDWPSIPSNTLLKHEISANTYTSSNVWTHAPCWIGQCRIIASSASNSYPPVDYYNPGIPMGPGKSGIKLQPCSTRDTKSAIYKTVAFFLKSIARSLQSREILCLSPLQKVQIRDFCKMRPQ